MMRDTPRTFVGTVVFRLSSPLPVDVGESLERHVAALSGVSFCGLDEEAGLLVVTAEAPVERTDVLALVARLERHAEG